MLRKGDMLFAGEEVMAGGAGVGTGKETERPGLLKSFGLLVGGPLLGLVYVIFLPVLGLATLGWLIGKAISDRVRNRRIGG